MKKQVKKKIKVRPILSSKKTKTPRGKKSDAALDHIYENPIKEIIIRPKWYGSCEQDVRDFAIQLLTGYIWECKYQDRFHAQHNEVQDCERLLYHLEFLKKKGSDGNEWWPTEEEELQLALIDFVRLLPSMWD